MADKKKIVQAKNVMVVLYNEEFKGLLSHLAPSKYAYILHNKFTEYELEEAKKKGIEKKAHWHLLLSFETKKTLSSIAKVLNVQENLIEVVNNFKAVERYLVHLDDDNKYKFDVKDVTASYNYAESITHTKENILQFLIEECEKYDNIREFNLMVVKLGIDYMNVYKQYYSMIKDIIYFASVQHKEIMQESVKEKDVVKQMCDDELLKVYHNILLNDGETYSARYIERVMKECEARKLIACEGLIIESEE